MQTNPFYNGYPNKINNGLPDASPPPGRGDNDPYALVTGASRGLGREFALELARRKINVLAVALPDDGLPELCRELKAKYNVRCIILKPI
jgi:hypothetical protein